MVRTEPDADARWACGMKDWQVIPRRRRLITLRIDNVGARIGLHGVAGRVYRTRRDLRTGQQRAIRPEAKAGEPHYRFQWNSPVAVSCSPAHDGLLRWELSLQID